MERRVEELGREKSKQLKDWSEEKKRLMEALDEAREVVSSEKCRLEGEVVRREAEKEQLRTVLDTVRAELTNEQVEKARAAAEAKRELDEAEKRLNNQVSRAVELVCLG